MAKTKITKEEPIEKVLWATANKLRKNIDAAEYKHVVLGLIFLRYISDSFEKMYRLLSEGKGDYAGADPEDKDEYKAENVFFVPTNARWSFLLDKAKSPEIGKFIDSAMDAIEQENPRLKGVLPKVYAKENLDTTSLGQLVDMIGNIALGNAKEKSADVLGHVFEYFLGEFALAEGKKGGQFYTPRNVVSLLTELIEPYKGRVYDPCCGSGGMFVQSEKFVLEHQGKLSDISIYGQESNQTTWRLAKMNLAIRGIDSSQVKWNAEGSFLKDEHKDLKADFIIANPPFNDSNWGSELLRNDGRWMFGVPPENNANFGWLQHFLYHLSPNGKGAIVMHGGAASNKTNSEKAIRKKMIEDNVVDCIIALPTQLFYNTTLPVHIWILNRKKSKTKKEILMIDAYDMGVMVESTLRILQEFEIDRISQTYKNWLKQDSYTDESGFCRSVSFKNLEDKNYILSPNRYVPKRKKVRAIKYIDSIKPDLDESIKTLSNIEANNILNKFIADDFISKHKLITDTYPDKTKWIEYEVKDVIHSIIPGNWGSEELKKNTVAVKVLRGTDLPNVPLFNLQKTPTRYLSSSKLEEIKIRVNDIVIEMSGGSKDQPTGRAAFITKELLNYLELPVICSNFCKVIRVDSSLVDPFWFYIYWINAYKNGVTTRYENQPSGIKNFQLDEFIESELILIPEIDISETLYSHFKSIFDLQNKFRFTSAHFERLIVKGFDNIYSEYQE